MHQVQAVGDGSDDQDTDEQAADSTCAAEDGHRKLYFKSLMAVITEPYHIHCIADE